jgi:hypothetical protein
MNLCGRIRTALLRDMVFSPTAAFSLDKGRRSITVATKPVLLLPLRNVDSQHIDSPTNKTMILQAKYTDFNSTMVASGSGALIPMDSIVSSQPETIQSKHVYLGWRANGKSHPFCSIIIFCERR